MATLVDHNWMPARSSPMPTPTQPALRSHNLIVDKLDRAAYKTYLEDVLPLKLSDVDLPGTFFDWTKLFGRLTRARFEFLRIMPFPDLACLVRN
ncbi:hypothetical protein Aduo_012580 [Ancylostoma duodenale]